MTDKPHSPVSRRRFVAAATAALAGSLTAPRWSMAPAAAESEVPAPRQATGVKVGEVTDSSAIVWTRLTAEPTRNAAGLAFTAQVERDGAGAPPDAVSTLEGACPGAAGRIRVRHGLTENLRDAVVTDWADVSAETDFAHQFQLTRLVPGRTHYYAVETTSPDGAAQHGALHGRFETAPVADSPTRVTFCVTSCQRYHNRDHADGHNIYPSMLSLDPKFVVFTGDNVYYDGEEPRAVRPELARSHWHRMHSLPRQIDLMRHTAGYWEKDDHDTLANDSWPGQHLGQLTWEEGIRIFRQMVPFGQRAFRTARWGRDLQIWLTEGRDYRSPNNMPDGPEKTIWGAEQKAWLEQTLVESDATWKLLISPTPIVGPDRGNKRDNHSNQNFEHEGDEIRRWFQSHVPDNFFVICGDRHWQYRSVHPKTGLVEFGCGPSCDKHAGGSPGEDKAWHRFHRVLGGFLSVAVGDGRIVFRHHDVWGQVVHQWQPA